MARAPSVNIYRPRSASHMEDAKSLQVGSQPTPHEVNTGLKTFLEELIAYAESAESYSPRGPSATKTPPNERHQQAEPQREPQQGGSQPTAGAAGEVAQPSAVKSWCGRKEGTIPNAEAQASEPDLAEIQATNTLPEAVGQDTSGSSSEEQRWMFSANETAAGTQKQSGSDDAAQAVSGDEDATAAMPPPSSTTAQKDKCTATETET